MLAACTSGGGRPSPEYDRVTPAGREAIAAALADSARVVLRHALADSAFPGAIAVVGDHAGVLAQSSVGHLDWSPSAEPNEHTLWDIASLTKVVGVTTAAMLLVQDSALDLGAPVQRYLPTWTGPGKERVTVRMLLTHTSGLPAFRPYERQTKNPDSLAALMFATPLDSAPGQHVVYSDIGEFVLGRVLEAVTHQSLEQLIVQRVLEPLGMRETMFNPPASLRPRIAPTEVDPERGGLVWGKVHDERAYYLGGVAAHAGLFSSASDLTRLARMYLNRGRLDDGRQFLRPETLAMFTQRAVEDRALGWQKPTGDNSAGALMPESAVGHTGFTGTSIWIDPEHDVFVLLLSNRVNPTRANTKLFAVRRRLADAVMHVILAHSVYSFPSP